MSFIILSEDQTVNSQKRIAENDIECYKVIEENLSPSGRYSYKTLPMYAEIPEESIMGKTPFYPKGDKNLHRTSDSSWSFTEGYIHSFRNLDEAVAYMEINFLGYAETRPAIYRCLIPKGTEYLETISNSDKATYSSDCLVFIEPLLMEINGIIQDYQKIIKQEKKRKYGIVFEENYDEEETNFKED